MEAESGLEEDSGCLGEGGRGWREGGREARR